MNWMMNLLFVTLVLLVMNSIMCFEDLEEVVLAYYTRKGFVLRIIYRRLVSSVEWLPDCRTGGQGFEPQGLKN